MAKNGLKLKPGHSKEDRKQLRKTLGSLRSLTVQPITRKRYDESLQHFYDYLAREGLDLPSKRDKMDQFVSDYIEYLWSEGEGRASASNFLAALQDRDPKLKGLLPLSWRLMRTWTTAEVPNRAPPLTETVLKAMVGWSFLHEHFRFGISLLVGFYGLLRTGELLSLQAWQFQTSTSNDPVVVSLGLTKSGKRQGAAESITLTEHGVIQLLRKWKAVASPYDYLTEKPHVWREMFQNCLKSIGVERWDFRPYSLRRGGATSLFVKIGSLDRVLLLGRWTAVKTAKIYLNSGLAMLADIQIPKKLLRPFHLVFNNFLSSVQTLEPALLIKSRTGGRGKNKNTARIPCKKAKKASKTVKKTGLKRAKRPGGGQQSFSFRLCLVQKCLGLGVPRFGGEPRSIVRGIFCAPVWREHKVLGPPILKDKNLITRIV